jgi:predicted heme/steroid binding protein
VQKHVDSGDMWLVVQDKVYDVSNFKHTGGIGLIKKFAGKDATKSFKGFKHSQKAHEILESMLIGRIDWDNKDPEITPIIEKPKAESLEAKLTVKSEPVPEMTPIIEKLKAENSNFLPEVKVEANQIKKVDSEEASSNPLPNSEQNPAPQKTSSKSESWRNPTFTVPVVQKNWKVGSESTSSDKRLY